MMSALITSNTINMKNIGINDIEEVIKSYLNFKHPNHSNGFIIRLEDHIKNSYNRRRSYIIKFPHLHEETDKKNDQIREILNTWTEFAINNIVPEYDLVRKCNQRSEFSRILARSLCFSRSSSSACLSPSFSISCS